MSYAIKTFFISCLALFSFFPNNTALAQTLATASEAPAIRIVIYYDGDIDEIVKSKDNYLTTFLATYNLEVVNTFSKDELVKGFTVETKENITESNFLARELSLIDGVLMVEIIDSELDKPNT